MSKHSFTLSLADEDYQALKALAEREDRHIYEQARHMLRGVLNPEPSWPPTVRERAADGTIVTDASPVPPSARSRS